MSYAKRMARLSPEEKTLLARILEDEEAEEDAEDGEQEEPDEFTYQGRIYRAVEEEGHSESPAPARKAPRKKAAEKRPAEEESKPATGRRRFLT